MTTFVNSIAQLLSMLLFGLLLSSSGNAQKIEAQFFKDVDVLLNERVTNGLVDYKALLTDKRLGDLIQQISTADISKADAKTKQAFYINAYNLHVINNVLRSYPTNSVLDETGFFDSKKIKVANSSLTLNDLEKGKLLNTYKDARFHFVLVCGALGCPPITDFAYTPEKLEAQLEKQTKLALNDPSFIKLKGDNTELSEIFKWYANDFGTTDENVIKFINKYRIQKIPSSAKVSYYSYNWKLNGTNSSM